MWKLIYLAIGQSLLLSGGQVFLKYALERMGSFEWSWAFFGRLLINWQFLLCGICYAGGTVLWMYILKKFPFSMAYPMISLSYVFGMIAAIVFFHESIPLTRWIGVFLIITGCVLIAR